MAGIVSSDNSFIKNNECVVPIKLVFNEYLVGIYTNPLSNDGKSESTRSISYHISELNVVNPWLYESVEN